MLRLHRRFSVLLVSRRGQLVVHPWVCPENWLKERSSKNSYGTEDDYLPHGRIWAQSSFNILLHLKTSSRFDDFLFNLHHKVLAYSNSISTSNTILLYTKG